MTDSELITPGNRAARGHRPADAYDNLPTPDEYAGDRPRTAEEQRAATERLRAEWRAAGPEGRADIEAWVLNDPWADEVAAFKAARDVAGGAA